MGRAIFYCGTCSTRVSEDDILQGMAFKHGDRVLCAQCAPSVGLTPAPPSKRITAARRLPTSTPKLPLPALPPEEIEEPLPSPRRRLIPILVGGIALGLVVSLATVFMIGEQPAGPAPAPSDPVAAVPAPVEETRPVRPPEPARPEAQALNRARQYAVQNPDDLTGQMREFEKVRWAFESSREAQEALREVEALRARLKQVMDAAFADVEKDLKAPLERRNYTEAIRILEAALPRLRAPEWGLLLGRRIRELREAKLRAGDAEPSAPVAPDPASSAPPAPAETKPRTEEGKAYLSRWVQSAARAAGRDFSGALGDLERESSALKEDESRGELAQDLKDLRDMETLHRRLLEAAAQAPRGRFLALETLDGTKVAGMVLRSDAHRVELLQGVRKPTAFVEWKDATAASLAAASPDVKGDARSQALLLLVDGGVEAARAALDGKPESVPAKYWTYAAEARSRVPKPERRELDARELFYSAEREFRAMETRGPACEKYRTLQNDYAATALVRSAADRIQRRTDACREYYLVGGDFRWEGTFQQRKDGRLESREDTDLSFANRNWVDLEFFALAETPYRCWVLLGGCCQETFEFWLQGSEMTDTDPKTRKKVSVEPGGKFASPGKHSIRNLKATHAACSPKKEPKQAARWEWVEIPLPKYAAPGLKRVRFMTGEKGFGVGAAVVSAARKALPTEAEVRDLERARAGEIEGPLPDFDLIGHWTFDEGKGNTVADSSGNGHTGTISGTPRWTAGKIGGALAFDGKETCVTVADTAALRIRGDITIAFWVRMDASVHEWQRIVGKGDPSKRTYGFWIAQANQDKVLWQHYGENCEPVMNFSGTAVLQVGKWYHVAGVVANQVGAIYIDGRKEGEGARSGDPAVSSDAPFTIGHGGHHTPFNGAMDDVRLYRRALSAVEIQTLHSLGR